MSEKLYMAKMYGIFAGVIFFGLFIALLFGFITYSDQNRNLRLENSDLKGQVKQVLREKTLLEEQLAVMETKADTLEKEMMINQNSDEEVENTMVMGTSVETATQ